jgi:hypothetical protein
LTTAYVLVRMSSSGRVRLRVPPVLGRRASSPEPAGEEGRGSGQKGSRVPPRLDTRVRVNVEPPRDPHRLFSSNARARAGAPATSPTARSACHAVPGVAVPRPVPLAPARGRPSAWSKHATSQARGYTSLRSRLPLAPPSDSPPRRGRSAQARAVGRQRVGVMTRRRSTAIQARLRGTVIGPAGHVPGSTDRATRCPWSPAQRL